MNPVAGTHAPGRSDAMVRALARYVRFQKPSAEVTRLLAELGDDAALRAGTVHVSREQADAVYAKLEHEEGTASGATLTVTVASGNTARMTSGEAGGPNSGASAAVAISSGAATHLPEPIRAGVSLEITPQVLANKVIEMNAEVRVTAFEGFVEHAGASLAEATAGVAPKGFLQPVYSTATVRAEVRAPSGSVVVVKVDEAANDAAGSENAAPRETWVLFIHVEALSPRP